MQIIKPRQQYLCLCSGMAIFLLSANMATPQQAEVFTVQGVTPGAAVQASAASAFINSIGVDTHFGYPEYATHSLPLMKLLVSLGIKHIRDGAIPEAMDILDWYGIKQTLVIDPPHGLVPDETYWSAAPASQTRTISQLVKSMPFDSVEALEMPNELDVFFNFFKWHPEDAATLSTDPNSPSYYGKYGEAITKDSWAILKSDPVFEKNCINWTNYRSTSALSLSRWKLGKLCRLRGLSHLSRKN